MMNMTTPKREINFNKSQEDQVASESKFLISRERSKSIHTIFRPRNFKTNLQLHTSSGTNEGLPKHPNQTISVAASNVSSVLPN